MDDYSKILTNKPPKSFHHIVTCYKCKYNMIVQLENNGVFIDAGICDKHKFIIASGEKPNIWRIMSYRVCDDFEK